MIVNHLIADTFGTNIGKYSKRLKITQKGTVLAQAPLLHLQTVTVASRGVSISADAIAACCERGIPIAFLSDTGQPYASLYASGLTGTVITRREQIRAYDDTRGTHIALTVARAKVENQESTLRYLAKNRKDTQPTVYKYLYEQALTLRDSLATLDRLEHEARDTPIDIVRPHIMGAEGAAARVYWDAVGTVIPDDYGWSGRTGRGATDPINSLLNYGYGILYSKIEQAVILAGLDPYAGFLHADRSGKPSLVLDLIEEFRQITVDRLVVGLAARNYNIRQDDNGRLCDDFRATYAEKVIAHLDTTTRYAGKRHPLRHVIQNQARTLASYLRGNTDAYEPFRATW